MQTCNNNLDKNNLDLPQLMTAIEVAKILNCTDKTIYKWIDTGILKGLKINGLVRIKKEEVLKLIN